MEWNRLYFVKSHQIHKEFVSGAEALNAKQQSNNNHNVIPIRPGSREDEKENNTTALLLSFTV